MKRNWLAISKLTWGIWETLIRALEILKNVDFNVLLLSKVYIVCAKKCRWVISHEIEYGYKIWTGIELSFQNWQKEFDKFWPEHSKVSKTSTLMGSFWAKYILFELKSTEKLSFMKLNSDTKFRVKLTCRFKIGIRNLTNFDLSTRKSQKFSF